MLKLYLTIVSLRFNDYLLWNKVEIHEQIINIFTFKGIYMYIYIFFHESHK